MTPAGAGKTRPERWIIRVAVLWLLFASACGEESRCDKVCGNDYGFERGDEENRVCFCETYDGRIYGPVPVGEEQRDVETNAAGEAGDLP